MLRLQWTVLKAMWCCGRGSRCVVVETDTRLKQGSRVLKVAFSTLLIKLVDYSIVKAVLVEVLNRMRTLRCSRIKLWSSK